MIDLGALIIWLVGCWLLGKQLPSVIEVKWKVVVYFFKIFKILNWLWHIVLKPFIKICIYTDNRSKQQIAGSSCRHVIAIFMFASINFCLFLGNYFLRPFNLQISIFIGKHLKLYVCIYWCLQINDLQN